ncbi:protein kinase subdomain-containing protein [Nannizzia gypsea CBS 118893]|uniref:Protein kinase subdomain-containing protein n=1 Tax=Arthroderma gypseum (strain ATCC MYA-4604 / CBS 118893) TaxID=535722 RepID=E4UQU9_ARTGP|nr:protein kinase subdomain-containing protein [Nannizzia gypsea CBS 118893]EFQ99275.1 protein kinase subdomain-containing protein [Nannizzia gypsea CBS 118893]
MVTVQDLPLEALQQICGFVASSYRPSLYDFTLVCKRWFLASNAIRFQKIRLTVENPKKLSTDLDHWNDVLRSTSGFGSVRRLEFEGELLADGSACAAKQTGTLQDFMVDSDDELESMLYTKYKNIAELPEVTIELDTHWTPVAHFVAQLRALRDLVFDCTNQFPPCLLDVLHQTLPNCRLHLHTFGLRNLYSYTGWARDLTQHEYALATSPSLHCITLLYGEGDPETQVDYHDLAVMRMSQGLAPNLRHVRVAANSISQLTYNIGARQRPKRDVFPNDTQDPNIRGELYSLKLSGALFGGLQAWNERIVFSSLQELILDTAIDPFSLEEASAYNFTSLRTLSLRLESDMLGENGLLDEATSVFLRSLPPLTALKLVNNFGHETFKAIIERHTSLQRIWLSPQRKHYQQEPAFTLTLDKIQDLTSHCSELRKVCLLVPRILDHSVDMAIYQSLGRLPQLKDLRLYREGFCRFDFDLFLSVEGTGRDGLAQLGEASQDAALNDDVARHIFHEIYQAQSKRGRPVFERLRIQYVNFTNDPPDAVRGLLDVSNLGFSVTLSPTQTHVCREAVTQGYRPPHLVVTAGSHIPEAIMRRIQQLST